MSQVTVTDVQDVALMKTEDIRRWISLHKRSIKNEEMKDYWGAIKDDLDVLEEEWKLRNPIVDELQKINKALENIVDYLKPNTSTGPK